MRKVVTQQRRGRASNPRLLDRNSDALPLSHRATLCMTTSRPAATTEMSKPCSPRYFLCRMLFLPPFSLFPGSEITSDYAGHIPWARSFVVNFTVAMACFAECYFCQNMTFCRMRQFSVTFAGQICGSEMEIANFFRTSCGYYPENIFKNCNKIFAATCGCKFVSNVGHQYSVGRRVSKVLSHWHHQLWGTMGYMYTNLVISVYV